MINIPEDTIRKFSQFGAFPSHKNFLSEIIIDGISCFKLNPKYEWEFKADFRHDWIQLIPLFNGKRIKVYFTTIESDNYFGTWMCSTSVPDGEFEDKIAIGQKSRNNIIFFKYKDDKCFIIVRR